MDERPEAQQPHQAAAGARHRTDGRPRVLSNALSSNWGYELGRQSMQHSRGQLSMSSHVDPSPAAQPPYTSAQTQSFQPSNPTAHSWQMSASALPQTRWPQHPHQPTPTFNSHVIQPAPLPLPNSSLQHLQSPLQLPPSSLNAQAFMPGLHDAARPFPHTAVTSLLRQAIPSGEELLTGFQTLAQQQQQQQLLQGAQDNPSSLFSYFCILKSCSGWYTMKAKATCFARLLCCMHGLPSIAHIIESFHLLTEKKCDACFQNMRPAGSFAHATAWNWTHAGMRSAQGSLPRETLHPGSALPWSTHSQVSLYTFSGSRSQCRMFARGHCESISLMVFPGVVCQAAGQAGRAQRMYTHAGFPVVSSCEIYACCEHWLCNMCRRRCSKLNHSNSPRFHSRASCPRQRWAQRSMLQRSRQRCRMRRLWPRSASWHPHGMRHSQRQLCSLVIQAGPQPPLGAVLMV